jgi:hypothetical protein
MAGQKGQSEGWNFGLSSLFYWVKNKTGSKFNLCPRPKIVEKGRNTGMYHSLKLVWIALGIFWLTLAAPPAQAESAIERYLAAEKTFDALKIEANAKGQMPRISDPRTALVLAVLADKSETFGTSAFPTGPAILENSICGISNKVAAEYRLAGLNEMIQSKKMNPDGDKKLYAAQLAELEVKNLIAYQDEVLPLISFGVHCMAGVIPTLTSFFTSLPSEELTEARLQGLSQMRLGIKDMIVGSIVGLGDTGIRDTHRVAGFDGLKRDLPQFVPVLTIANREDVIKTITALKVNVTAQQQKDIAAMLEALGSKTCEGLCAY